MTILKSFSIALLATVSTFSAVANETAQGTADGYRVEMNSKHITLTDNSATLIRTSETPNRVKIKLPVELDKLVCVESGYVQHSGIDASRCGVYPVVRYAYRDVRILIRASRRECSRVRGNQNETCVNYPAEYRVDRVRYEYLEQVAASCTWEEYECVRKAPRLNSEMRTVTLKFKRLAKLSATETETYELTSLQKRFDGNNVDYNLRAVDTKGDVKIKSRDGLFTLFKDVITVKPE